MIGETNRLRGHFRRSRKAPPPGAQPHHEFEEGALVLRHGAEALRVPVLDGGVGPPRQRRRCGGTTRVWNPPVGIDAVWGCQPSACMHGGMGGSELPPPPPQNIFLVGIAPGLLQLRTSKTMGSIHTPPW